MTQYSDSRQRGPLGLKSRITRQLIIWSLIVGSVASLLISGGEAYLNYQERLNGLDTHIQSVGTYTLPPLVQSLWAFDDQQLLCRVAPPAIGMFEMGNPLRRGFI